MTRYPVPTKDGLPRRIQIDSKGIIWFGEYNRGKIGRFDPQTEMFQEYDLPTGPLTHPYGLGIDAKGDVWYSSYYFDVLGRLIPARARSLSTRFLIPKTLFESSSSIRRDACGTGARQIIRLVTFI